MSILHRFTGSERDQLAQHDDPLVRRLWEVWNACDQATAERMEEVQMKNAELTNDLADAMRTIRRLKNG